MTYNLDEGSPEYLEFIIGGFLYKLKYPTTDEMEEITKLKDADKITEKMYEFVTSDATDAPPIDVTLGKVNVKVGQRFVKMIKDEFYGEL